MEKPGADSFPDRPILARGASMNIEPSDREINPIRETAEQQI